VDVGDVQDQAGDELQRLQQPVATEP
jgi:hypothetical protein